LLFYSSLLDKFLADEKIQIPSITLSTTAIFAELSVHARSNGSALSNNDLWIASIAKENNYRLVTFDKDFEVLLDIFGKSLLIL